MHGLGSRRRGLVGGLADDVGTLAMSALAEALAGTEALD